MSENLIQAFKSPQVFAAIIAAGATLLVSLTTMIMGFYTQHRRFQKNEESQEKIEAVIDQANGQAKKPSSLAANEEVANGEVSLEFNEVLDRLIRKYHNESLSQSKAWFITSLIASISGFLLIIVLIVISLSQNSEWYISLLNTVPGIIIEGMSSIFYSQSKEIRERSSDFLNRLREDRLYEKGIKQIEKIDDTQLMSKIRAEIALRLCGVKDINVLSDKAVTHDDQRHE